MKTSFIFFFFIDFVWAQLNIQPFAFRSNFSNSNITALNFAVIRNTQTEQYVSAVQNKVVKIIKFNTSTSNVQKLGEYLLPQGVSYPNAYAYVYFFRGYILACNYGVECQLFNESSFLYIGALNTTIAPIRGFFMESTSIFVFGSRDFTDNKTGLLGYFSIDSLPNVNPIMIKTIPLMAYVYLDVSLNENYFVVSYEFSTVIQIYDSSNFQVVKSITGQNSTDIKHIWPADDRYVMIIYGRVGSFLVLDRTLNWAIVKNVSTGYTRLKYAFYTAETNKAVTLATNNSTVITISFDTYAYTRVLNVTGQMIYGSNTEDGFAIVNNFEVYFYSILPFCSGNTIFNKTSQLCQVCDTYCSSCANLTTCKTCMPQYFLQNGTCMPCRQNCTSCLNRTFCTECVANTYRIFTFCSVCPKRTWYMVSSFSCPACPQFCASCISYSVCLTCSSGNYFIGTLCGKCPIGTVYNSSTLSCDLCSSNCSVCISPTKCQMCYITSGTNLIGNSCGICPFATVYNPLTLFCDSCSFNCISCISAQICIQCSVGNFLVNDTCVDALSCPSNCQKCSSPIKCLECEAPYEVNQKFYCKSCLITTFYDSYTKRCQLCSKDCLHCTSRMNCLNCSDGKILISGFCLVPQTPFEEMSKIVFLNEVMQFLNKIPGSRALLSQIFYFYTHIQQLQPYIYHQRYYGYYMSYVLQLVHNFQEQKSHLISDSSFEYAFGFNPTLVSQKLNYKISRTSPKFIQIQTKSTSFFQNSLHFFLLSLPSTLLIFLLFKFIFLFTKNCKVAALFSGYSSKFFIFLMIFQGNLLMFSYYFIFDTLNAASLQFQHKFLNLVTFFMFWLMILYISAGAFMENHDLKSAYEDTFLGDQKNDWFGSNYLQYGILSIFSGAVHLILENNYTIQICVLCIIEASYISFTIFLITKSIVFKKKLPEWCNILASFLRICLITTFLIDLNIPGEFDSIQNFQKTLSIIYLNLLIFSILSQFFGSMQKLYRILISTQRKQSENSGLKTYLRQKNLESLIPITKIVRNRQKQILRKFSLQVKNYGIFKFDDSAREKQIESTKIGAINSLQKIIKKQIGVQSPHQKRSVEVLHELVPKESLQKDKTSLEPQQNKKVQKTLKKLQKILIRPDVLFEKKGPQKIKFPVCRVEVRTQ